MRNRIGVLAMALAASMVLVPGQAVEAAGAVRAGPDTLLPSDMAVPGPADRGAGAPIILVQDGGPDFWVVAGVPSDDTLSIRTGPGTGYRIIGRAPNGVIFRNLGCRGSGNSRWCQVETRDGAYRGWVAGRYLRESGGGSAATRPDVPELALRRSGEIEVRWSSGCTMLYNGRGNRLQAGGSCSRSQRDRSDDAVARYLREQGGSTAGPSNMRGFGQVTQGGSLSGRISSRNGRVFALVLSAPTDGLYCTGEFDEPPGSRSSMSTIIRCTNGATGSAILHGEVLTFSAGGKGGYVHF